MSNDLQSEFYRHSYCVVVDDGVDDNVDDDVDDAEGNDDGGVICIGSKFGLTMGPVNVTEWLQHLNCADSTDVTLADEDDNSI